MKKCEKCQIKVDETADFCPVCGGRLTVSGKNGEFIFNGGDDQPDKSGGIGFEGILNMSFDEKLKGIFMRNGMKTALIFMLIYMAYFVFVCINRPIMILSGLVPAAVTFCILYAAIHLKKGDFKEAAHTSAVVLYAVSIAYMCIFILAIAAVGVCGAILAFGAEIPWNFAFIYSVFVGSSFEIGIAVVSSVVLSAAIMLPYFISMIKIADSLKNGLGGKNQDKILGVRVFRVYTYIGTILVFFASAPLILYGELTVIFALLWNAAQIMIVNALCDFDKVLKL